jgi:hypothetical protein
MSRAREESWRPFDLGRAPLFRARIYRLGTDDHLLVVTTHHIISDAWSTGVLVRETAALYQAFAADKPSPLPPLPVQYADFAAWQRHWLQGEALEGRLAFWREALAGVPPLDLPTDRPRPSTLSGRGSRAYRVFPAGLVQGLRALGRSEGVTLYMTILAGFELVLSRHSGQTDFAVGTPVAGRSSSQVEGLIGLFVNTLALRADLSGSPSFRDLLRRVKSSALAALTHQDVPFDQVVNALGPARDSARSPVFQVMLVLQNAPMPAIESPALTMTAIEIESVGAKFELTLSVIETAGGLDTALEYSTDLFEAATAERFLGHLETLLTSAAAEPDQPAEALSILTEEEQRMLLHWSGDETPAADPMALADDELDALIDEI